MTCTSCGDRPKTGRAFPSAVVEINNPEQLVLLRKVVLPATLTEADNPPVVGKYRNVILQYEDTGHIYLYSSDGIPTAIESNVPQEVLDRIADLESDLAYETSARQTADTELGDRIDAVTEGLADETTARETADAALSTRIDGVASAVTAETTARQAADTNLQSQIDAITASSDVTDIVGTYAQLQAYDTSTLGDNDIIKVLQDETHNDETTYYRWNATTQQFALIGEEGPYYTKSQADTLLNAKQNTLTAGSNVQIVNDTISATDTTYTHFTGATASTDGVQGLVPGPLAGDEDKFLKADGTWGTVQAGPTVVQTTGASTTDVMSQNATTGMIYADPGGGNQGSNEKIKIGRNVATLGAMSVVVGANSRANGPHEVVLGDGSVYYGNAAGTICLGATSGANITAAGMMDIGSSNTTYGYNSSNYRLLTGLYDGQSAHDAVTVGQLNTAMAGVTGAEEINSTDWSALWQ